MKIKLIVAVDSKWGISSNNKIPWNIVEDMNFFTDTTKSVSDSSINNVVIMGKNTWKALPTKHRGLINRTNIVVSSTMTTKELDEDNISKTEAFLVSTLTDAINICSSKSVDNVFICGGKNIYSEAMTKFSIDEYFITQIMHDYSTDVIFDHHLMFGETKYDNYFTFGCEVNDLLTDSKVKVTFNKYRKEQYVPVISEQNYLSMLMKVLTAGDFEQKRNGTTWSMFGHSLEFDLYEQFPLLTTKQVFFRGLCEELFFFLKGQTDTNLLADKGVKIWVPNTSRSFLDNSGLQHYKEGDMGPMYGYNLVHYGAQYTGSESNYEHKGFNQVEHCLRLLKTDPFSRRIIMTTFNPATASEGVLYPCHGIVIMFNVCKFGDGLKLSCMMTQRSADSICGIPFNIGSYALLVYLFCEVINNDGAYTGPKFVPGRLIMNFGDVHIYSQHYTQSIRQILREPRKFPRLKFNRTITNLTDIKYEDIELVDYHPHPKILVKMIA